MKTILVVCTANICRSPMAAALIRKRLADQGLADAVEVQSAGVYARAGMEASALAGEVLASRGISLADHRSQPVSRTLLERSTLVLTMEEGHRRSLFYLAPQYLAKVFLLSELTGKHDDIEDPYGGPIEDYVRTADQLDKLIAAGWPAMLKRLGLTDTSAA